MPSCMCKKYTKTFCSSIFDSFLPGGSAFLPNVSTQKKIFETFSCFLLSVSVFLSSLVVFGRLVGLVVWSFGCYAIATDGTLSDESNVAWAV